ncbi:MAG: serine/threonine protein kinase [Pirellulaceae bacterium]|nr:serine/threonine protein kinase [Pirellulaceae bacterium]
MYLRRFDRHGSPTEHFRVHFLLHVEPMPDSPTSPSSQSGEPDLTGRQFGDYQVLRRLGAGAMAEVYLARQRSLGRQVAVKVLRSSLSGDENYVQRFYNEARAAASLVHANIVQIHEVGRIDGTHFIAQEYVRGQNLGQYLQRHGPLSVPFAVTILRQACAALQVASEHSIVHRDIKPENIMLSVKGEVKVADFGLARRQNANVNLTQVGVTMGTPLYMSPEQVHGNSLDSRSDIYSLGVTFFHMLTGAPPFEGDSPLNVAIQHVQNEPPDIANIRRDLPAELSQLIHRTLAKSPDDRFQTPEELSQALRVLHGDSTEVPWPTATDLLGSSSFAAQGTSRVDATQRLDRAMKQESKRSGQSQRPSRPKLVVALLCCVAFFGAVMVTMSLRRVDPLRISRAQQLVLVSRRESAESQFALAQELHTEQGYQSVRWFFPGDEHYVHMADIALGRYYLEASHFDPNRALPIFETLTSLDEAERGFRAAGLAGEVMVYHFQGNFAKSLESMSALKVHQLMRELPVDLREEIERISERNQRAIRQSRR